MVIRKRLRARNRASYVHWHLQSKVRGKTRDGLGRCRNVSLPLQVFMHFNGSIDVFTIRLYPLEQFPTCYFLSVFLFFLYKLESFFI